jgi:serine/threonine protein kinase
LLKAEGPIEQNIVKVSGFEFAREFSPNEILIGEVGNPSYMAPEVLAGAHSNLADIWSCGVVMYRLCSGYLPFGENSTGGLRKAVQRGMFSTSSPEWAGSSESAKGLIQSLMKMTACFRPTAACALEHNWLVLHPLPEHLITRGWELPSWESKPQHKDVGQVYPVPYHRDESSWSTGHLDADHADNFRSKDRGRPSAICTGFDDAGRNTLMNEYTIDFDNFDIANDCLLEEEDRPSSIKASMNTSLLKAKENMNLFQSRSGPMPLACTGMSARLACGSRR